MKTILIKPAQTGFCLWAIFVVLLAIAPARAETVKINIISEYGGTLVSPPAGELDAQSGQSVQFSAPLVIYLDRYKNALGTTDSPQAYYRARYLGASTAGGGVDHVSANSFSVTVDSDMTLVWVWGLEYLGGVDVDSTSEGLSDADAFPDPTAPSLGRSFLGTGAADGQKFDSVVNASVAHGVNEKFTAKSYVLENAPGAVDRSAVFSPGSDYMRVDDIGVDMGAGDGSFTVDFWARRDPVTATDYQTLVCIGSANAANEHILIGFRPSTNTDANSFFLVDGSGGTDAPSGLTDNSWHHWAAVNDGANDTITLYRDGEVILQYSRVFDFHGDTAMAIGATLDGSSSKSYFSGGVNNVRVWSGVRSQTEIAESMRTTEYGSSTSGLEVEVTFDDYSAPPLTQGITAKLYEGSSATSINSVDNIANWPLKSTTTQSGLVFPAGHQSEYFGMIYEGYINIGEAGSYNFFLQSDDGSKLFIDGDLIVDNDGVHGGNVAQGLATLTAGYHEIKVEYFNNTLDAYLGAGIGVPGTIPTAISSLLTTSATPEDILVSSSEGRNLSFQFLNYGVPFGTSTAATTTVERLAILFPGFEYREVPTGAGVNTVHLIADDGSALSYQVSDWTRVTWLYGLQYLLEIKVSASPTTELDEIANLPYIHISDALDYDGATSNTKSTESDGVVTVHSRFIDELSTVTVGTRYRTASGAFVLTGVPGHLNAFGPITITSLKDGTYKSEVSREYTIDSLVGPGTLVFQFTTTDHQATIPIGEGLDVSFTANANLQLTPDLVGTSPLLAVTQAGPTVTSSPGASTTGELTGGQGASYVWDFVGKKFYPLQPGTYVLTWPDAILNTSYSITIIADFPDTAAQLGGLEDDLGNRLGTAPDYLSDHYFESVSDEFPASPGAHYRYAVSDGTDVVPVELDPLPQDRWKFNRMAYSETADASVDPNGSIFTCTKSGKRSVMVYSYRSDPTQIATGDLTKEKIAVFVVESVAAEDVKVEEAALASTNRRHLHVDEATGIYAKQISAQGSIFGLGADWPTTWQFAVRLDEVDETVDASRIILESHVSVENEVFQFGLRSPVAATNPGGFYLARKDDTSPFAEIQSIELDSVAVDQDWHNWSIVFNEGAVTLYRDNSVVGIYDFPIDYNVTNSGQFQYYGYSFVEGGGWLNGDFDNLRIWARALTVGEVRQAILTATPSSPTSVTPDFGITFDATPSGSIIPKDQGTTGAKIETFTVSGTANALDALVTQKEDTFPEVATRILSKLDTASLGSGFLLNSLSNYNAGIYDVTAAPGEWGAIYPVNWSGIFLDDGTQLHVAYYENPYNALPSSDKILHPNVAWPYVVVAYDDVTFPKLGEDAGNQIVIASRLGSEGVDIYGNDTQLVFDPTLYANVTIYNQPDRSQPGYNPNEEHALVAPSIKGLLTGDSRFSLQQPAVFALQQNLNHWAGNDKYTDSSDNHADDYTSETWVNVQYDNLLTGQTEMATYQVETTRQGAAGQSFPIDILDSTTHLPDPAQYAALTDPGYDFEYPIFAGDLLVPPYPLNLVVANATMPQNTGANLAGQRTLWQDKNQNSWAVSGNGQFSFKNWYPLSDGLWLDFDNNGSNDYPAGTPISWLPDPPKDGSGQTLPYLAAKDFTVVGSTTPSAGDVYYNSYWRESYPMLKRGESVTYAGGEFKAENPLAAGLPGIVGWASAELVFDSQTPSMVISSDSGYTARITRPLDRHEADFDQASFSSLTNDNGSLTPASPARVLVVGSRWYFKELTGSLQKRFYYDVLYGKLVFRGRLNDLESGDPNLTATPVSLSILEPNVMSADDYSAVLDLGGQDSDWTNAVTTIYSQSQNPTALPNVTTASTPTERPGFFSGLQELVPSLWNQYDFYLKHQDGVTLSPSDVGDVQPLNSLGTGSVLVPNPTLLTADSSQPLYVTLVENNNDAVAGAVALHVIEISPERYRGAIKVVEAQDVFDEKINLRHTGDFGGNTEDIYYQWWIRDTDSLDVIGRPDNTTDASWQTAPQFEGYGLNSISFEGHPDIMLADKFFYVRCGERSEFEDGDTTLDPADDDSWRLVDINDPSDTYVKAANDSPVPYQWAGASNSPQLQSDGSKDYIPQLAMGWVKRILDRVNPYEARFTDFADNDSPSTNSSMLHEAGAPYVGDVALNSDKDSIEGVGLIELYQTILNRAKALTIDINNPSEGANQALLLAATRLSMLYDILAREAYADAENPAIIVTPENGMASIAPFTFAFQNQVSSQSAETLALLRGTDFVKAYPSYNRLFWNYVKGLGEAAYNANYAIWDVNVDGFINEFDAAKLYPQGHGDAWGHFLSASKMHYELLRAPGFDWKARSEYYSLLDNVLPTDFLDEKSFASTAAAKARAGKEIVQATYQKAYTADPDGQWQGYTDSANPSRAWGVSEWSHRAGQGAIFDWVVGNAILPAEADDPSTSGLAAIDRQANKSELAEIAAAYAGIQTTLNSSNAGNNPLGLDQDAVTFDIDPFLNGRLWERKTHFEQAYDRAVAAGKNALATFDYAADASQQLNRLSNDTSELKRDAIKQDISFRNQLIGIFGSPYEGTIGPGQLYPEGYIGADVLLYNYIDKINPDDVIPSSPGGPTTDDPNALTSRFVSLKKGLNAFESKFGNRTFSSDLNGITSDTNGFDDPDFGTIFDNLYLTEDPAVPAPFVLGGSDLATNVPVIETGDYAFQAADGWGSRGSYGRLQTTLNEMLAAEIELRIAVDSYGQYINNLQILNERISLQSDMLKGKQGARLDFKRNEIALKTFELALKAANRVFEIITEEAKAATQAALEFVPKVEGLAIDGFANLRGVIKVEEGGLNVFGLISKFAFESGIESQEIGAEINELRHELDNERFDEYQDVLNLLTDFAKELQEEKPKREEIGTRLQRLHILATEYNSTLSEGLRLLDERSAMNKFIASTAQTNRYKDMALRLTRNDAMTKYQDAFKNAARYAWLAAKAYDYETGLSVGDPAAATTILGQIIQDQGLGMWVDGQPAIGKKGLAEALAQLKANFDVLHGQLGLNNPQYETGVLSLRYENYRISNDPSSDQRWKQALSGARVDDLWQVPEFRQYCRPFADPADGAQPGIVLDFSTQINPGLNVFGQELGGGDQTYSVSNFATKISTHVMWFQDYDASTMATTPRAYLIPVGDDVMRLSNGTGIESRSWNIVEQRVPVPFAINQENLNDLYFVPSLDATNGSFGDLRRTGDSLAFMSVRGIGPDPTSILDDIGDSRHVGRSIWNTRWLLIIPGINLHANPNTGLDAFVNSVTDVQLQFETYSHEGQ